MGGDIVRLVRTLELLKDEYENYVSLRLLSINPEEPEDERQDHKEFLGARRTVLRNRMGRADEFGSEVETALVGLEQFLKLKLVG